MNDERRTPPEVFDPLNRIFGFNLDPCTTRENPLGLDSFYTLEHNGLSRPWQGTAFGGKAFVNCPYSRNGILPWIEKAHIEAMERGVFSFLLLPNDSSTGWWRRARALAWATYLFESRIRFMLADGTRDHPAKFPSIGFLIGGMPV